LSRLVIAIDGPSGAGKSTAGRSLARRLGYAFVDTGAMYRALALKALRARTSLDDGEGLATLLRDTEIALSEDGRVVSLDGEDATAAIRAPEVAAAASRVSAHRPVRAVMVTRQRRLGERGGVVLDGRDIGTAVFPDADVKFFVDAAPVERARRRAGELAEAGGAVDLASVAEGIRARDHADTTRADSPLVRAGDAVYLDTTGLSPDEVLERMLSVISAARPSARRAPS
jgi:cytidylate kinase